jgi:hypothetical protein
MRNKEIRARKTTKTSNKECFPKKKHQSSLRSKLPYIYKQNRTYKQATFFLNKNLVDRYIDDDNESEK